MAFAVEIFFDATVDLRIRELWDTISEVQNPSRMTAGGYRPHISLAVFDGYPDDFETDLQDFVHNLPPLKIRFPWIGIFPRPEGVVFFGALLSDELGSVHRAFHNRFAKSLRDSREYYQPGHWVPHCTLAIGLAEDDIPKAVRIFADEPLPVMAQATEIGVVEFPHHREVATFAMKGCAVGNPAQP